MKSQPINIDLHVLDNVFLTVGVDLPGHLEGLRGGHVCVRCSDSQDDAVGVRDVLQD